jgi:multisubunit Na+/H+ antiporter MnhG subunit
VVVLVLYHSVLVGMVQARIIHIIWAGVIAITLALVCVCILSTVSRHTLEQAWYDSDVPVCRYESGRRRVCLRRD